MYVKCLDGLQERVLHFKTKKFILGHTVVSGLRVIKNVSKKCFENLRINVIVMGYTLKTKCFETCVDTFFFNYP